MNKHTSLSYLPSIQTFGAPSMFARPRVHFFPEPAGDGTGEGKGTPAGGAPPASNGAPAGASGGSQQTPKAGEGGEPKPNPGQFTPDWLNDRIAQAKRSAQAELLKEMGITDPKAAKELLDAGKKAIDATKSELQRKDEENKALRTVADQAKVYQEALTKRADAELLKLPEAARERVKSLAGDDPVKLLDAIDLALTMGAGGAPSGTPAGQQGQQAPAGQGTPSQGQQKPPVPPAANTTGAAGGPPSAPGSETDHLAVWRDMQAKNPFAAAQYYLANQATIVAQQQKQNQ